MATLPIEIITEILVRLPVKSLIRFLCVNKLLHSLIKNPNFIKLHLDKTLTSNSEGYLVLFDRFFFIAEFNLENVQIPPSFSAHDPSKCDESSYFVGSCNGIVCIYHRSQNAISLYNPLTKSCQKIPVQRIRDPRTLMDDDDYYFYYDDDDDDDEDYNYYNDDLLVYGFGYDSVTDDYKVLSYYQTPEYSLSYKVFTEAEVFSVKNKDWKPIKVMCDYHSIDYTRGVYLNNALYYVFYKENLDFDSNYDLKNLFIAKFDCETDTLLRMDLPNVDGDNNNLVPKLSALDGYLCMLVNHFPIGGEDRRMVRADFWVMKSMENDAWVKLFSILDPRGIGINIDISTVAFSKDWSKILLVVDLSKFGWYDLNSGLFETITPDGQPGYYMKASLCYLSGSLVSLGDDKLQSES